MRTLSFARRSIGVAAVAVALVAGVAVLAADANAGDPPVDRSDRSGAVRTASRTELSRAALDPGQNIEFVALSPACRMVDTRRARGAFRAGEARDYSARATAGQGADGSSCPVPASAVAVDVSLSTIGNTPTGSGFAQVGPALATPSATVLQYLRGQGTSVTTTIPLEAGGIRIRSNGAGTHMAIDVLGYWQRSLHAAVGPDGTEVAFSGLTGIAKSTQFPGLYFLEFERDVSGCSAVASPSALATDLVTRVTASVGVDADGSFVIVDVRRFDSQDDVDGGFELVVEC